MRYRVGLVAILSFFSALPAHPSALMVDINSKGAPANDLIYQGQPIDEDRAWALKKSGVEIWKLNPTESLIWTNSKLPVEPQAIGYPADGGTVQFHSNLESTQGLFRSSVDFEESAFTLTVSLEHHAALIRAALFRKLGYPIQTPRFYRSLTVRFASIADRDQFLDTLSSETLAARARWVRDLPQDRPEVTLQGVVLEPGRMSTHPFHWGWMTASRLQGRRSLRATVVPMLLGELGENINEFEWESGQIFGQSVVLQAFAADAYAEATYDDLKWMIHRIASLQREDYQEILSVAGLPTDINRLVLEKLIQRRNHLVRLFDLDHVDSILAYNPNISIGNVEQGKLKKYDYPGYPTHFAGPDPDSPIRRSELFKFFKISLLSGGIDQIATQINQAIPQQLASDVIKQHQEQMMKKMVQQQIVNQYLGTSNTIEEPVGFWGGPFGSLSVNASRSVTTGTYYGSTAPLQLIDNVGVSGNAGYLWGYSDPAKLKPGVIPTATVAANLSRNYIHVKPISDVGKGLETSWADAIVSRFMPALGEILESEQQCDLDSHPIWVRQYMSGGLQYYEIMYDNGQSGAEEAASAKKDELAKSGITPELIMIRGVNGKEACDELVKNKTEANLNMFLSKMQEGEAFIVVDSLNISGNLSVSVPLSQLLATSVNSRLNASTSAGAGFLVLRRTHFVRTKTGVQIYIQTLGSPNLEYGMGINFYTSIAAVTRRVRAGYGSTQYYPIELETADFDQRKKAIRALRALFIHNEAELVDESFPHFQLDHDITAKILNTSVISRQWDSLREDHIVAVLPPKDPLDPNMNPKEFERKLYLNRSVDRTGDNYLGFFGSLVSAATSNRLNLFTQPPGTNPGATPFGRAKWSEVSTESEITPGADFRPVTIIEDVWAGWSLPRKKLFRIFNEIEERFIPLNLDHRLINRGVFNTVKNLQLYEIKSTLILYPKALTTLSLKIFDRKAVALNLLFQLFGKDHCEVEITPQARLIRGNIFSCYSPAVNAVMDLRNHLPSPDRVEEKTRWLNQLAIVIRKHAKLDRLLKIIGTDSYLLAVKISGFKTNDHEGTSDYLSSTLGTFDPDLGSGLFKDFSSEYGISMFEMYARYFSTGF